MYLLRAQRSHSGTTAHHHFNREVITMLDIVGQIVDAIGTFFTSVIGLVTGSITGN